MNPLRNEFVTLSYRRVGVLMETNLSLFCLSSLGGGGRGSDPICTMSRNLPFLGSDGAPYPLNRLLSPLLSEVDNSSSDIKEFFIVGDDE